MKTTNCLTSACRYCRFYNPEGRRGGACEQLGVPVEASWKACSLALPPFTSAWESLEEIMLLESAYHLDSATNSKSQSNTIKATQAKANFSRANYSKLNPKYFNQEVVSVS